MNRKTSFFFFNLLLILSLIIKLCKTNTDELIKAQLLKYIKNEENKIKNATNTKGSLELDLLEKFSRFKVNQKENEEIMKIQTSLVDLKNTTAKNQYVDKSELFSSIDLHNFYDVLTFPYQGTLPQNNDSLENIVLQVDYSNLQNMSRVQKIFLRMFIMPRALENITSLIRIKFREELYFTAEEIENCHDEFIKVPNYYKNQVIYADMLIFVNSIELESDTFAMTSSCVYSPSLGRTIASNLVYNNIYLDLSKQSIEEAVETVQHEMIHAFVFDNNMFQHFPYNSKDKPSVLVDKNGRRYLTGDNIIKQAKDYFGCNIFFINLLKGSSIDRIPLEDEGGEGTESLHFEKSLFHNELMVSDTNFDSRMSRFTLAIFNDSGAYEANPVDGTDFQHGYQRGCDYYFGLFKKVLNAEIKRKDLKGRKIKKKLNGKSKYLDRLKMVKLKKN